MLLGFAGRGQINHSKKKNFGVSTDPKHFAALDGAWQFVASVWTVFPCTRNRTVLYFPDVVELS